MISLKVCARKNIFQLTIRFSFQFSSILFSSLLLSFSIAILLTCMLSYVLTQECYRTNCKTTIGDMQVFYSSFTKTNDVKFAGRTASHTFSLTGTKEERERRCASHCSDEGVDACKSAHLAPYQAGASTCELFAEDVYDYDATAIAGIRESSSGWTSFHIKVNTIFVSYKINLALV